MWKLKTVPKSLTDLHQRILLETLDVSQLKGHIIRLCSRKKWNYLVKRAMNEWIPAIYSITRYIILKKTTIILTLESEPVLLNFATKESMVEVVDFSSWLSWLYLVYWTLIFKLFINGMFRDFQHMLLRLERCTYTCWIGESSASVKEQNQLNKSTFRR